MGCISKKYNNIVFLLFFSIFCIVGISRSYSAEISIEELKKSKEHLRDISLYIFNRKRDIEYIQDKICTHSPQLLEIWKQNKWQQTPAPKRKELEAELQSKFNIVASQTRRLLQRDEFSLLYPNVIDGYISFGNQAIRNARDEDVTLLENPGNHRWAIKILAKFPEIEIGALYLRDNLDHPHVTHTLCLTFDVQDIVEKILLNGLDGWNKEKDGYATTMCAEQNQQ